ncbi:MAG: hypothetical protein ACTHMA_08030 [Thermomicrobiales bacterium]
MWWWGMDWNMAGMHFSWFWGAMILWVIFAKASRYGRRDRSQRYQRRYAPPAPVPPQSAPAPQPAPTREEQLAALGERYAHGQLDRAEYETRRSHWRGEAPAATPQEHSEWPNLSES